MIKREAYMKKIRPFIGTDLIKVMTGMRRCGKSVMLELIQQEIRETGIDDTHIIVFNFEDLRYHHLLNAVNLNTEIIKRTDGLKGKVYLFFDEIQEVEDWEKCINSLRVSLDCDIYITGSNAKLLSGELATYLGGRYVEFVIYPFSYSEFEEMYRTVFPDTSDIEIFRKYLIFGGMPYLANLRYQDMPSRQYLQDLFNSVQLKDIVQRNNIRDTDLLERIISYVMMNAGNTFSASSIVKYLKSENRKVSTDTVLNYIRYCCDAYLFYKVRRQELQGKQILSSNEKYYIADHGIREAIYGGNMKDINLVLENIVYMELQRRGYSITVGKAGDKEVDFVCEMHGEKIYIQVSYLLAEEKTIEREFGVYKNVPDNFPKFVVTMDELDMSRDGIRHWNIREFLKAEKWV